MEIEVEWCYHSYVILRVEGVTIAIDPHDGGSIGLPTCRVNADYILVTHDHFDHNAVEVASGQSTKKVFKWYLGSFEVGPFKARGVKLYHDKAKGKLRGWVAAYVLDLGDIKVAHMGDLGHLIYKGEEPELEGIDVMFIPVGGVYTISGPEAWAVIEELGPRIAVPIHYWLPGSILPLDPLERFLEVARSGRTPVKGRTIKLSREALPPKTTIMYFDVKEAYSERE